MSIEIETKIEGLDKLEEQLRKLDSSVGLSELRKALMATASPLKAEMKRLAPVSTAKHPKKVISKKYGIVYIYPGYLKSKIKIRSAVYRKRSKFLKGNQIAMVRVGVFGAFYGKFLEFGTSTMRAQPFVAPAALGVRKELNDKFVEKLKKNITKALGAGA